MVWRLDSFDAEMTQLFGGAVLLSFFFGSSRKTPVGDLEELKGLFERNRGSDFQTWKPGFQTCLVSILKSIVWKVCVGCAPSSSHRVINQGLCIPVSPTEKVINLVVTLTDLLGGGHRVGSWQGGSWPTHHGPSSFFCDQRSLAENRQRFVFDLKRLYLRWKHHVFFYYGNKFASDYPSTENHVKSIKIHSQKTSRGFSNWSHAAQHGNQWNTVGSKLHLPYVCLILHWSSFFSSISCACHPICMVFFTYPQFWHRQDYFWCLILERF